ncbi:hypothetical protein ACJX0J_012670, partial [Zea mays]
MLLNTNVIFNLQEKCFKENTRLWEYDEPSWKDEAQQYHKHKPTPTSVLQGIRTILLGLVIVSCSNCFLLKKETEQIDENLLRMIIAQPAWIYNFIFEYTKLVVTNIFLLYQKKKKSD